MSEKLLESLEQAADRRSFLGRTAAAAAALVVGVLGLSTPAQAVPVQCCSLCFSPSTCSNCACWWSWVCCVGTAQCPCYSCKECFNPGYACAYTCTGVKCSSIQKLAVC